MNDSQRPKGLGAAARISALAGSVMDLHLRIALQEVDREKRRLIGGFVFIAIGGLLLAFSLLVVQVLCIFWMINDLNWNIFASLFVLMVVDLFLAGLSLRIGGRLAKGPYLPETLEGISKTTKAVLGRT